MKTYRIKPLEWRELPSGGEIANDFSSVHIYELPDYSDELKIKWIKAYTLHYQGDTWYHEFDSVEAAKAKAQELHEQELLKWLEVVEESSASKWVILFKGVNEWEEFTGTEREAHAHATCDDRHLNFSRTGYTLLPS